MHKFYFLIIPMLLLTNCRHGVINETVKGMWAIDTIISSQVDAKECLLVNVMTFKNSSEIDLPSAGSHCTNYETYTGDGEWEISREDGKLVLTISTNNAFFYGKHSIKFIDNKQRKLLQMRLTSKDLYLVASRMVYSYELNTATIQRLTSLP